MSSPVKKTIGFIVNPIAGMGGAVGLKGTDGWEILNQALLLGAKPIAPKRAEIFLQKLKPMREHICLLVGAGSMGEIYAKKQGFLSITIGKVKEKTTSIDTKLIAQKMIDQGIEILVFCGGDGTARDILDTVNKKIPVLGVPTGVKMHSAVFAIDPSAAVRITVQYLWHGLPIKETEIMDIDEEEYREGRVSANLYGYMLTPYEPNLIQGNKVASIITDEELKNQVALAIYMTEEMDPHVMYVVGPGTTTRTIADLLNEKKTLLGVDLFYNKKIIARDVNETKILEIIKCKLTKIIVTPIGGQGFIFGRGNQQISSQVIRLVGKDNVIIIATKNKLKGLRSLRIDTGDPELDDEFRGYIKVITDYKEEQVLKIE